MLEKSTSSFWSAGSAKIQPKLILLLLSKDGQHCKIWFHANIIIIQNVILEKLLNWKKILTSWNEVRGEKELTGNSKHSADQNKLTTAPPICFMTTKVSKLLLIQEIIYKKCILKQHSLKSFGNFFSKRKVMLQFFKRFQ